MQNDCKVHVFWGNTKVSWENAKHIGDGRVILKKILTLTLLGLLVGGGGNKVLRQHNIELKLFLRKGWINFILTNSWQKLDISRDNIYTAFYCFALFPVPNKMVTQCRLWLAGGGIQLRGGNSAVKYPIWKRQRHSLLKYFLSPGGMRIHYLVVLIRSSHSHISS